MASNVIVAVRIRPPNSTEHESEAHRPIIQKLNAQCILFDPDAFAGRALPPGSKRAKDLSYKFDHVFGPEATQEEVYAATAGRVIDKVVDGFNATIFAYGATGSGKTHSMVGTPTSPGVMVQCVHDLFAAVAAQESPANYTISLSYLEVYNENLRDLLIDASPSLALNEDKSGMSVRGLTWKEDLKTAREVFELLKQGNARRSQCATDQNQQSSRSHAVLQIVVKKFDRLICAASDASSSSALIAPNELWTSKLSLIDLAGSERAAPAELRPTELRG